MNNHRKQKGRKLASFYFLSQGVACLLPWNGVLSTLDFYDLKYPNRKVDFVFPIFNLLSSIFISFFMISISKKFSLNTRVAGSYFLIMLFMIMAPVIAVLLPNTGTGYWIILMTLFFIGILNNTSNSAVVGLAGYFPAKYMSDQTTGTGLGGIIPNGLRALIILFLPATSEQTDITGIAIYYGVSSLLVIACIGIHYKFINSQYAIGQIESQLKDDSSFPGEINEKEEAILNSEPLGQAKKEGGVDAAQNFKYLWSTFKELKYENLSMILVMSVTLTLYPGVMLLKQIPGLDSSWQVVALEFAFNASDTLGKFITGVTKLISRRAIYLLIILRLGFFFTFIVQATTVSFSFIDTTWFVFVNAALFGLSNGYLSSALFIIGPEAVEGQKKEICGFLLVNSLNLGILIGSLSSYPLSYLSPN